MLKQVKNQTIKGKAGSSAGTKPRCLQISTVLLLVSMAAQFTAGAAQAANNSSQSNRTRGTHYQLTDTKVLLEQDCRYAYRRVDLGQTRLASFLVQPLVSLATGLVRSGVRAFTGRLRRIESEYSASDHAVGAGSFFVQRKSDGARLPANYCLTIVRGAFGPPTGKLSSFWAQDRFAGLFLAADPTLYVEYHINYLAYPGSFELRPAFIDYRKPGTIRSRSKKLLAITVGFSSFGRNTDDQIERQITSFMVPSMEIEYPATLELEALSHLTTGFQPTPTSIFPPDDDGAFDPVPVTVHVAIGESEDPGVLARMMTDFADELDATFTGDLTHAVDHLITDALEDDNE